MKELLRSAWDRRQPLLANTGALRIFHGPSEGQGDLSRVAIEYFREPTGDAYAWIFVWEEGGRFNLLPEAKQALRDFLSSVGVRGAVLLERPEKGAPANPSVFFGEVPAQSDVEEFGLKYRIRYQETKHPGLFLDHAPLREWLKAGGEKGAEIRGRRVLNTFAYTGSLSVAAGAGGASFVTTLDLSRPTVNWARENWVLNFGEPKKETADFIYGDVFDWIPKLTKRGDRFDVVILDPPSFSRSDKKNFSTSKDLPDLHEAALRLLNPKGLLITSINSAQISIDRFRDEIERGADQAGRKLTDLRELGAPEESFPGGDRLKGWILRAD